MQSHGNQDVDPDNNSQSQFPGFADNDTANAPFPGAGGVHGHGQTAVNPMFNSGATGTIGHGGHGARPRKSLTMNRKMSDLRPEAFKKQFAGRDDITDNAAISAKQGQRKKWFSSCGIDKEFGYNSFLFRIPIYNLFHPFLDGQSETPAWPQINQMLTNASVTGALILALICTFYSSVSYHDTLTADLRFSRGMPGVGLVTPWDIELVEGKTTATGAAEYNNVSKTLGDGPAYPCYEWRQVDPEGTFVSGAYAEWWWVTQGREYSVTEEFNWACATSSMVIATAVLLAVLVLTTGSANVFTRDSSNAHGYQYRKVIRSYLWWVRFVLVMIIGLSIFGMALFVQSFKFLVYIKFRDMVVETRGDLATWPFANVDQPYGLIDTATFWGMWIWILLGLAIVSKGQHSAYCYPVRPGSDIGIQKKNQKVRDRMLTHVPLGETQTLVDFLRDCLTSAMAKRVGPGDCFGRLFGGEAADTDGVYLSAAAGIPAAEAEIVCDILFDEGIYTVTDLRSLLALQKTALLSMPGIQKGAAMVVTTLIVPSLPKSAGGIGEEDDDD